MDIRKESLKKHYEWNGKIEVVSRVPINSAEDLSLAYTPGVAEPCLEIQKDYDKSFELTRRNNLVAVVTDGTAVLGLAGMPVMEGKCALFKEFGDVDAFPICVRSKDVDEIVNAIYLISGSFGGINLEDIAAPRCFEIEKKLKETENILSIEDAMKLLHDTRIEWNGEWDTEWSVVYNQSDFSVDVCIRMDYDHVYRISREYFK